MAEFMDLPSRHHNRVPFGVELDSGYSMAHTKIKPVPVDMSMTTGYYYQPPAAPVVFHAT